MKWVPLLLALLLAGCSEEWGVDQHGHALEAERFEGRWLLVNYWAEWCGPCRTEIPELNRLGESEAWLQVVGVNFDGLQGEPLRKASESLGIRFPVLARDPSERLGLARPAGLPMSYLVDPQGRLRATLAGEQSAASVRAELRRLGAPGG